MDWKDAGLREEAAFNELAKAVENRQRINARVAIFDDHWEGYERAVDYLAAAIQAYEVVLEDFRKARSQVEKAAD